jgi:hypothetical protein
VTVTESFAVQPSVVPVTRYFVVVVGLTVRLNVRMPSFHKYEVAPVAVIVTDAPIQIDVSVFTIFTDGCDLTRIDLVNGV